MELDQKVFLPLSVTKKEEESTITIKILLVQTITVSH